MKRRKTYNKYKIGTEGQIEKKEITLSPRTAQLFALMGMSEAILNSSGGESYTGEVVTDEEGINHVEEGDDKPEESTSELMEELVDNEIEEAYGVPSEMVKCDNVEDEDLPYWRRKNKS